MPVFVVLVDKGREAVADQIGKIFRPDERYQLAHNSWLVSYDGTTQTCAETLHIRGEEANQFDHTGIVFRVSNYSGRFNTNVWEWFKLKLESRGDH